MSQENKMSEIKINEVSAQRINLKPGEVLMITIKDDDIDAESMRSLYKQLKNLFPDNKVGVMCVGTNDDIKISIVADKETDYTEDVGLSSHFANKE